MTGGVDPIEFVKSVTGVKFNGFWGSSGEYIENISAFWVSDEYPENAGYIRTSNFSLEGGIHAIMTWGNMLNSKRGILLVKDYDVD